LYLYLYFNQYNSKFSVPLSPVTFWSAINEWMSEWVHLLFAEELLLLQLITPRLPGKGIEKHYKNIIIIKYVPKEKKITKKKNNWSLGPIVPNRSFHL